MSKHIPGPWKYHAVESCVCSEEGDLVSGEVDWAADGHLIAAAPDLLAAARAGVENLESYRHDDCYRECPICESLEILGGAIILAEQGNEDKGDDSY